MSPEPDENDDDPTVVIDRDPTLTGDDLDRTVSLGRRRPSAPPEDDPVLRILPTPRPRTVVPAGPNTVESYAPREVLPAPVRASTDAPAASVPRAAAATLPSTARLSRRAGTAALVAAAAACAVSVAGIIAILAWFLG